jgi:uncharacterized repeat protein (TIGR03803 family)
MRTSFQPLVLAVAVIASQAQTFTQLVDFNNANGAYPCCAPLVQGTDGNLYGTTDSGGTTGSTGTFFKVSPAGTLTTLYNFSGLHGQNPSSGVILGTDGNFYGTTEFGGSNNYGTVFKITSDGVLTTLWNFTSSSNSNPTAPLVQATNGDFYGTTTDGDAGYGSIFRITPEGALIYAHTFDGADGRTGGGALIQAADGNLYGTTAGGGVYSFGTIFKMTPTGVLTTLHSFSAGEGQYSNSALVEKSDGVFYGTSSGGGSNNGGTVFKVTSTGALTTLYSFDSPVGPGGSYPNGIIQTSDGNFYGSTLYGGSANCSFGFDCGTIFTITPEGALTTMYDSSASDGGEPSSLVQATNGALYGTSGSTDKVAYGSLFSLSVGLRPFVETVPVAGSAGTRVRILGTDLTHATGVNFHGTPATFNLVSSSEITTTVPAGAITGRVQVAGPSGTLLSNVPFHVTQ